MHWDYWTFMNQPTWFIEGLRAKINLDARYQEIESRKLRKQPK